MLKEFKEDLNKWKDIHINRLQYLNVEMANKINQIKLHIQSNPYQNTSCLLYRNRETYCKVNMKIQETQNSKNNLQKEQTGMGCQVRNDE